MPIHDWMRVEPGIFHHFHHEWISTLSNALNRGILPPDHYALAEQLAGGFGPDVIALEKPGAGYGGNDEIRGGIALANRKPKVSFQAHTDADIYAAKANRISIRHVSDHRVVAVIEIVSPGNKNTRSSIRTFVDKAAELLRRGVHLLMIDPFPAGPRDPQGIHQLIWDELDNCDFQLPDDRRLTMASYIAGPSHSAFIEPIALGSALPDMPLFLTSEVYVLVPLEKTYQSAWEAVPPVWQDVLKA